MKRKSTSSLGLAKLLSWSFFMLVVGCNLLLSVVLADLARRTLIQRQEEFALLLASNLNHQIYQRFTLPTLIGFRRIELSQKPQYERLDLVVQSTIHSFNVMEVRIYGTDRTVAYSTTEGLVGSENLAGQAVTQAMEEGTVNHEIVSRTPTMRALFGPELEPGSVTMRTVHILRAPVKLEEREEAGPVMGVLEFTQDITEDYVAVIHFQRLVILASAATSMALFGVLLFLIRRADRVVAERAKEKEDLERELHQSDKLASMGRMVSGIAHEIRNPLGVIRSSAEMMWKRAKSKDPDSADTRILGALHEESQRLSRVVGDFLDYARPKPPMKASVDVVQVLDKVTTFLEGKCADQGVTLEREYASGAVVQGDTDLLYRAFYNLVANSLEALDGPGTIRLSVFKAWDAVTVLVQDTGPGFSPEALEKMRDPFFTTKDTGTGLGLAIVDTILQGHGAQLRFKNRPSGGAQAEIIFPTR